MIYIYDILLNFDEGVRILDFYEWDKKDGLTHIKKIPVFKSSSIDMDNIINGIVKVDSSFLEKINNKTLIYKSKSNIKYACLFCDLNRVVAVEFYKDGRSICKSSLLLDEEEEVIDECSLFDDFKFNYKVIDKNFNNLFLTRTEEFRQRYLLKEIDNLFKNKDVDKFNYLYEEMFKKDDLNIDDRYNIMLDDIKNNYSSKYNYLYEIVRLSYQKK